MENGYIRVDRSLHESGLETRPFHFSVLFAFLFRAAWRPGKVIKIGQDLHKIQAGDLFIKVSNFAETMKLERRKLRRILVDLEKEGFIKTRSSKSGAYRGTLVSLLCFVMDDHGIYFTDTRKLPIKNPENDENVAIKNPENEQNMAIKNESSNPCSPDDSAVHPSVDCPSNVPSSWPSNVPSSWPSSTPEPLQPKAAIFSKKEEGKKKKEKAPEQVTEADLSLAKRWLEHSKQTTKRPPKNWTIENFANDIRKSKRIDEISDLEMECCLEFLRQDMNTHKKFWFKNIRSTGSFRSKWGNDGLNKIGALLEASRTLYEETKTKLEREKTKKLIPDHLRKKTADNKPSSEMIKKFGNFAKTAGE